MASIIDDPDCQDILLDIGMPVLHRSVYYNCRVIARNRKIILIRPKRALANDGNFREMRYFTPWSKDRVVEDYMLPKHLRELTGETKVKLSKCSDTSLLTLVNRHRSGMASSRLWTL